MAVPACAASPEPARSRSAIVISARPGLPDANFDGSTILVTNSVADSPFGLVLNRPTQLTVAQLLPRLADSAIAGEKVRFGGPVQIDSAWFLFRSNAPAEHAVKLLADLRAGRRTPVAGRTRATRAANPTALPRDYLSQLSTTRS
jgi:putative AlgH/UPF0301 family transcriptional regulator